MYNLACNSAYSAGSAITDWSCGCGIDDSWHQHNLVDITLQHPRWLQGLKSMWGEYLQPEGKLTEKVRPAGTQKAPDRRDHSGRTGPLSWRTVIQGCPLGRDQTFAQWDGRRKSLGRCEHNLPSRGKLSKGHHPLHTRRHDASSPNLLEHLGSDCEAQAQCTYVAGADTSTMAKLQSLVEKP